MTTTLQELWTPQQVAEHLHMSRIWVMRRIAAWDNGDPAGLPAIKVSGQAKKGRVWRVDPAVLDEWLRSR